MANIQPNNNIQEIVHFEEIYDSAMVEIGDDIISETVETESMVEINIEAAPEVECGEVVIVTDGQENGDVEINEYDEDDIDYSQLTELTNLDDDVTENLRLSIAINREQENDARIYAASHPISEDSYSEDEIDQPFSHKQNYHSHRVDKDIYIKTPQPAKKRGRPRGSLNKNTKISRLSNNTKTKKIIIKKEKIPLPIQHHTRLSSSDESIYESEILYQKYSTRIRKEPKKRAFRHRLQWRDLDMLEALKSVQEMKTTIRGAAKQFAVPYSTLKDRVHGRVRHGTKPGVKTALSPEEEEELVRYVMDMQGAGFSLRYVDVRERAGELLRLNHGTNNPYGTSSPGHNWLAGFLKRHPGLEFRRPSNKSILPSIQKQKNMLRKFYEITSTVFRRQKILHKPDRIFCVSELRLSCGGLPTTILVTMAADGALLPPFVVFAGVRLKLGAVKDYYPEATFNCSPDGHVNEEMFNWWFREHFLKNTNYKYITNNGSCRVIRKPMSLFVSRWVVDVTLQLSQKSKEERLSLVCMPPGIAHLLQPLDDAIVHNIETLIEKKVSKHLESSGEKILSHKSFAHILSKVWRRAITSEHIKLKYNRNGLFPLNPFAISNDRIASANQLMARAQMAADKQAQESENMSDIDKDDMCQLSGRSILSVLASHEFTNQNQENDLLQEVSNKELDYIQEALTTSHVPLDVEALDSHDSDCEQTDESSGRRHGYQSSGQSDALRRLQRRQLEAADDAVAAAAADSGVTVQSQLCNARDNVEQTDLAINSILSTARSRGNAVEAAAPGSSDTDDAEETSWNIEHLNSQHQEQQQHLLQSPGGEVVHYDDLNVVYEEDIAATVDISSTKHVPVSKKREPLKRGPKKKKKVTPSYEILDDYSYGPASTSISANHSTGNNLLVQGFAATDSIVYDASQRLATQGQRYSGGVVEEEEVVYDDARYPEEEEARIVDDSEYMHYISQMKNQPQQQIEYIDTAQIKHEFQQVEYIDNTQIKEEYSQVQFIDGSQVIETDENCVIINAWNS